MIDKKKQNVFPRNLIVEIDKLLATKPYEIELKEFSEKSHSHDLMPNIRCYTIKPQKDLDFFGEFVVKPCSTAYENIDLASMVNLRLVSIDTLCFRLLSVKPEDPIYDKKKIAIFTCIFMHIYGLEELLPENSGESRLMYAIRCKFYNVLIKYYLIEGVDTERVRGFFEDVLVTLKNPKNDLNAGFTNVVEFDKKATRYITWICMHHKKIHDLLKAKK